MNTQKLGRPTDQRLALISGQASDLLWYGRIETTLDRAKAAARYAEKCITLAVRSYQDVVTEENLKIAYSIDVKLMELDDKRKVCVPMKTNLKLDL